MVTKGSVSEYIMRQPEPQREICSRLREIILRACPGIEERMKLGVPYYDDDVYILSLKDHVNLGLSIQGLSDQDLNQLKGTGKTARSIEFRSMDDINEPRIVLLLGKVRHKGKA